MNARILVVDDEPTMASAMTRVLQRKGFDVDTASSGLEAVQFLQQQRYPVVVSDLRMPGLDGRELVNRVRRQYPHTQVLIVTAFATVESAVACVRDGAVDYLMKPFSPGALEDAVARALRQGASFESPADQGELVAVDPVIQQSLQLAMRAAASDVTVLLEAESGAGKEVFARLIHEQGPRRDGPFVAVNCAALPRELLEAELFGHRRGAFTGAHRDRKGHFEIADGGTLLLDEIGEMNPDLQARLLRVLQDRQVQPVGSEAAVKVDVRVIAATNRNLREDVDTGRFREDLYYRLCVLPVRIPPLRRRPLCIEPLATQFALRFGGPDCQLTKPAMQRLRSHDWPGNVRELQNVIQRAAILSGGDAIDVEHIELDRSGDQPASNGEIVDSLEEAERQAIHKVLLKTQGNRTAAAEALGISPRTLRHKLKRFRDLGRPVQESTQRT